MKTARLYLSCCFFLVASFVRAQEYCVDGWVMDASTGEPALMALVMVTSSDDRSFEIAEKGKFRICNSEPIDTLIFMFEGDAPTQRLPVNASGKYLVNMGHLDLSAVQVVGFKNESINRFTPGSFGIITRKQLDATDQLSLMPALNAVPGVIMDSRGYGGSHRLSIRGSSLRAPFAVRNIKMYLEGIPLTSPDGTAPVELPDASDLSGIEIIKGPAGSTWGSGNGGVLLLKARRSVPGSTALQSTFSAGEYDWFRSSTSVETDGGKWNVRLSHNWQENYGYRQQEFNRKQQFSAFVHMNASSKLDYFFYSTAYNGEWGLPGALTAEQVELNPRQAVPFSVEHDAKLWRQRYFSGLSQEWKMSERWKNTTAVYFNDHLKKNPYGTSPFSNGYKIESARGVGGRTDFSTHTNLGNDWFCRIHTGAELQRENFAIDEYQNELGTPGELKYHYDVDYLESLIYLSSDLVFRNRFLLTTGVSSNQLRHGIQGYSADGFVFDSLAVLTPGWLPRVAASARIAYRVYGYVSIAAGNSNPTVFEQISVEDGRYNVLNPEKGRSTEVGVKGTLLHWDFDCNVYRFRLSDAILPVIDTASGVSALTDLVYRNGGSTIQDGIELSFRRMVIDDDNTELYAWINFTASHYVFGDYLTEEDQLKDFRIPGVPLHTASFGINWALFKRKLSIGVTDYWVDKLPLNNRNEQWSSAYHLLNSKVNYTARIGTSLQMDMFFGVNNVLNSSYTSFFQLNGNGGKFFNPAPARNVYGGVSVRYLLQHKVK